MDLNELVSQSIANTKASLWPGFAPELVLCGTIFLMLIIRLFRWGRRFDLSIVMFGGALVALYHAAPWKYLASPESVPHVELFTGMLVFDAFAVYVRAVLIFFALLFAIFTRLSGIPDREDGADFYCLILGATVGMCLMASANHLLMVFLAVEMASVPSYALAGMLKGRRVASEAALKYAVYGAGAAGVMLYGISLLAGILGTCHLPTLATELAARIPDMADQEKMVLALGGLMVMVGLAFKLSAVPFHFWCPDVFEGASAEVNAFLSVASKAGALALLVRVAIGCGVIPSARGDVAEGYQASVPAAASSSLLSVADASVAEIEDHPDEGREHDGVSAGPLAGVREFIALVVGVMAMVTCTFGNLAAYGQTNMKRLMAYSTIAHAGYMMLAVPAAMLLSGVDNQAAERAVSALALYIGIYLFMNLGAFAIVAFLRNSLHSEQIEDYAGLIQRSPGIVICTAIILFSLVGMPPLAGFLGKFAIFAALVDGYRATNNSLLLVLLLVGGINTAVSLFYYLRVIKVMAIDPPGDTVSGEGVSMLSLPGVFVVLITLPILLLFVSPNTLSDWTLVAAQHLFS